MTSALLASAAGMCWLAATVRMLKLRNRSSAPEHWALWGAIFGLAAALTTQVPPVYLQLGTVTGVPNVALLVGHSLVLIAAWSATVLLLYSTLPAEKAASTARRRMLILVVGLASMTALFVRTPAREQTLEYAATYGHLSSVTEYYLIYLSFMGLAALDIGRLCWRYARLAEREVLRLGLHLLALSGAVALAYVAYKGTFVAADRLHLRLPLGREPVVTRSLIALGTLLVLAGTTVSVWGSRLGLQRLYAWTRAYRSYRRLFPLWRALYEVTPTIALYPPHSRLSDVLTVRDLDFRLHRRVIEIRDGWLALRPYLSEDVERRASSAAQARGLSGDELRAAVAARVLGQGVAAKAADRPSESSPVDPFSDVAEANGEVAWLERVARAYSTSAALTSVRLAGRGTSAPADAQS